MVMKRIGSVLHAEALRQRMFPNKIIWHIMCYEKEGLAFKS
ncbi:hypothetical protein HanIR_Chr06g0270831 [Helianthus annuus]|nr:hypothetical protein HanIR_Chr06g0270831 [Helianthus annuus]